MSITSNEFRSGCPFKTTLAEMVQFSTSIEVNQMCVAKDPGGIADVLPSSCCWFVRTVIPYGNLIHQLCAWEIFLAILENESTSNSHYTPPQFVLH